MATLNVSVELNASTVLPEGVLLAGYRLTCVDGSGVTLPVVDLQVGPAPLTATFSVTNPGSGTVSAVVLGSDGKVYGLPASGSFTVNPPALSVAAPSLVTVTVS